MEGAFLAQLALSAITPFREIAPLPGFDTVVDDPWLRLLIRLGTPTFRQGPSIVVGQLYSRSQMRPVESLKQSDWDAISHSGGRALLDRFWGNYVAFLRSPMEAGPVTIRVIRGPLGRLGCYWSRRSEKLALASEPALLFDADLAPPAIDRLALALHIAQPEIAPDRTCLEGIQALRGGNALIASPPSLAFETLWSPWEFCADTPGIKRREEAGVLLRTVLTQSIAAQTTRSKCPLLLLSGGLDSSLLAACLSEAGQKFHALNLVTHAGTGDERDYARIAAKAVGTNLTEAFRGIAGVDICKSGSARHARPHGRAFTQETERQALLVMEQIGGGELLDGGGGDNLFYNYTSLAPLVEILRKSLFGPRFWQASLAMADLTNSSMAKIVARTIHRAMTRGNRLRFERRDTFLSNGSRAAICDLPAHPWREPPVSIGHGKAAHVALLAPAQATAEQGTRTCGEHAWISPFICQPVLETVLGLPVWSWFAMGSDRAAARMAFRDALPARLLDRRTKGTPNTFVNQLFEAKRSEIRSMLLDGVLAAQGIIDLDMVREQVDNQTPARDFQFGRIMELVDAEAWARSLG